MFDETKVQIGNEVILSVDINSEWYISSVGYEYGYEEKAREVTITLKNREDENKLWQMLGEIIAEPKDEPQTCSVNGRPYSECSDCEYFRCTADESQKIMEKCYKCKWWNYSYGCSNKKGVCEFEPLKDE